jgi:hypothetical protein
MPLTAIVGLILGSVGLCVWCFSQYRWSGFATFAVGVVLFGVTAASSPSTGECGLDGCNPPAGTPVDSPGNSSNLDDALP